MKTLEKIIYSGKNWIASSILAASLILPYNSQAESIRITPEYNSENIGLINEIVPVKLSRNNNSGSYKETKNSNFYISGKIDKQKQVISLGLSTLRVPDELPLNKTLTEAQKRMPLETIFDEINLNRTKIYALHSLGTEIGETTQKAIIIPGERLELKPLEESLVPKLQLKYGEKLINKTMEFLPKFCSTLKEEMEERELARTESKIREEKDNVDSALQITKIPLYPKEKGLVQKPEIKRVIEIPYKISAEDQLYIAIDLCTGLGRQNEYRGELEAIIEIENRGIIKKVEKIPIKEKDQEIYGNWRIIQKDGKEDSRMQINSKGFMIGPKDMKMDFSGKITCINIKESVAYRLVRVDSDEYEFIPTDQRNEQEVRLIREGSSKAKQITLPERSQDTSKRQIDVKKIEHGGIVVENHGTIKPPISQQSMDNFERNIRSTERSMKRLFGK